MGSIAQLNYSSFTEKNNCLNPARHIPCLQLPNLAGNKLGFNLGKDVTCFSYGSKRINADLVSRQNPIVCAGGGGGGGSAGVGHGGGGGGGGGHGSGDGKFDDSSSHDSFGPIGAFLSGWRSRVAADPQFPFKVLMEEVVGVSANVLGDMATRPNFGLNELDFVFSTLVVGSIMNFTLMYLLAPTMGSASTTLPFIFASSPTSHMFEPGAFSLVNRLGTFVYKGTVFAAVGFAAGLVGTALSNGLIKMRKKMDPSFESPNKPPPTVLNAMTWAIHMGISSNFRYQALNGIEYSLAKALPDFAFKTSVIGLRLVNNVLGGMTFVMLARLTGSQSTNAEGSTISDEEDKKIKLLSNEISSK
ncbi:reticulata-related 3, chloroplastic-like protein [Tanacetum coccineum]